MNYEIGPVEGIGPVVGIGLFGGTGPVVSLTYISIIFKDHLYNSLANRSLILSKSPWEGGKKVYIKGPGDMTKMAATSIYGKTFKKLLQQN